MTVRFLVVLFSFLLMTCLTTALPRQSYAHPLDVLQGLNYVGSITYEVTLLPHEVDSLSSGNSMDIAVQIGNQQFEEQVKHGRTVYTVVEGYTDYSSENLYYSPQGTPPEPQPSPTTGDLYEIFKTLKSTYGGVSLNYYFRLNDYESDASLAVTPEEDENSDYYYFGNAHHPYVGVKSSYSCSGYVLDINSLGVEETSLVKISFHIYGQTGFDRPDEIEIAPHYPCRNGCIQPSTIETLGGTSTISSDINDSGQVTGRSKDSNGDYLAFLWRQGEGIQSIDPSGYYAWSAGLSINSSGEIVGYLSNPYTNPRTPNEPFFWNDSEGMNSLQVPGGMLTFLNDTGLAAGHIRSLSIDGTMIMRAFVWDRTSGTRLLAGLGGPYTHPTAINNNGQVVGASTDANVEPKAFLWDEINGMRDLGFGKAQDINNHGQVIITNSFYGPSKVWRGEREEELIVPDCYFVAINNSGFVAGRNNSGSGGACAYDINTETLYISENMGGSYTAPLHINDLGQIVGVAESSMRTTVGFYWNPWGSNSSDLIELATGGSTFPNNPSNQPTYNLLDIAGINNYGEIVGSLTKSSRKIQGLFWDLNPPAATPHTAIEATSDMVQDLVETQALEIGEGDSLEAKLEASRTSLDKGNEKAASNIIGAFINQTEAFINSERLSETEGNALVERAEATRNIIYPK